MDAETVVVRFVADTLHFLGDVRYATARFAGYVTAMTTSVARSGIEMAATFERNSAAIKTMVGDAAVGAKLIDDLTKLAVETPFSSQEMVESAKQLKAFGFETNQIIDTLKVLGNVSAGTGTSMERIILAFGQVRVAGKLMGTELRQFTDAGIPLMENLAAVMGKPEEAIRKLVEQGMVGFDDVVNAFNRMNAAGGTFAGQMDVINRTTLSGRWQEFRETLDITTRNFATAAVEGLGLKNVLTDVANALQAGGGLEAKPSAGLVNFFKDVRAVLNGVWMLLKQVGDAVREVAGTVGRWADANQHLVKYVVLVVGGFWSLYAAVKAVTIAVIILRGAMATLYALSGIMSLVSAVTGLKTLLVSVFLGLSSIIAGLLPFVALIGSVAFVLTTLGAFRFSGDAFTKGWEALKGMKAAFAELVEALRRGDMESAMGVLTTSLVYAWKVVMATLKGEWEAFKRGLGAGWSDFMATTGTLMNRFKVDVTTAMGIGFGHLTGEARDPIALQKFLDTQDEKKKKEIAELVEASKQRTIKAEKDQAEMIRDLLDPTKNPTLKAAKDAMDAAVANSKQAGVSQSQANALKAFMVDNVRAIGGVLSAMKSLQGKFGDLNATAAASAFGLSIKDAREFMAGFLGNSSTTISPAMEKLLPPDVTKFAARYAELMGIPGKVLPPLRDLMKMNAEDFAKLTGGFGISGRARTVFNDITKEFDEGITFWEKEAKRMKAVNEAYFGSAMGQNIAAAAGGFGLAGKLSGPLDDAARRFEDFNFFQRALKEVGGMEYRPPPAALAGSQQAQDIVNANLSQQRTTQEEVLATLQAANELHRQSVLHQKDVADSVKALREKGILKALGLE